MNLKQKIILLLVPTIASVALRALCATLRVEVVGGEGRTPETKGEQRFIYGFWHGQILPVVGFFAGNTIQSMASRSFDGEIIARALKKLGYPEPSRGSSSRGGGEALKTLADGVRQGRDAVLTPDGPRGPRHKARSGIVALARLSGLPALPVAFRCRRVIRLNGWDKMEIPLPFSRAVAVFGDPITVSEAMSGDEQEKTRVNFENALLSVNAEAERRLGLGNGH